MLQANRLLITTFCLLIHLSLWAQSGNVSTNLKSALSRADDLFDNYSYSSAAEWYKVALRKDPDNYEILFKIAESYRMLNDSKQTEEWYARLAAHKINMAPEYKLYYAQALHRNGKYSQALHWFQEYLSDGLKDGRVDKQITGLNDLSGYYRDSAAYEVKELGINSPGSDFAPAFYRNGLVFVSAQRQAALIKQVYSWDDSPLLDLYFSAFQPDGSLSKPQVFDRRVNTKLHEGPIAFFDQDRKMVFTRSNYLDGKVGKSKDGVSKLKLFYAEQVGKQWVISDPFPFNNSEYSVGNPTISSDGKTLYFVSDMPGGYGGLDIYTSTYQNGKWGTPQNMGNLINTEGNENFPFLYADQVLYFSSDGQGGLGGLDIYKIELSSSPKESKVVNLGFPINTQNDDFAYIQDQKNKTGYFSSNRNGGKGKDDLYQVHSHYLKIEILAVNARNGDTLRDASLRLFDSNSHQELRGSRQADQFVYELMPGAAIIVKASKEQFIDQTMLIPTADKKLGQVLSIRVKLEPQRLESKMLQVHCYDEESGKPLANARVYLLNEATSEEKYMQTDTAGNFTFPALLKDSYALIIDKDNRSGMITDIRPDSVHQTISLPLRRLRQPQANPEEAFVVLSVEVSEANTEQSLSGVLVHVQEGIQPDQKALSKANQSLYFGLDKDKMYILRTESDLYEKQVVIIDPTQAAEDTVKVKIVMDLKNLENILTMQVFDEKTGENLGEQNIMALEYIIDEAVSRIQPPPRRNITKVSSTAMVTLQASIKDASNGSQVDGATVKLFVGSVYRSVTVSEKDGTAAIQIESPGNHVLKVYKEGYHEKIVLLSTVDKQEGEVLKLQINIDPKPIDSKILQVHCYDEESKKPLANARVYLLDELTSEEQYLQTDTAGNLSFTARLQDSYALIVDKDDLSGMMTDIRPDSIQQIISLPLRKVRHQAADEEVTFVMLAVEVLEDGTDRPLSGVAVHVQEGIKPRQKAHSTDKGEILFRLPAKVQYVLKSRKDMYQAKTVVVPPAYNGEETIKVVIRMEKQPITTKMLQVYCFDEGSGKPMANAKVYLLNELTSEEKYLQTDAAGNFSFTAQLKDSYALIVDKGDRSGMMTDIRPDSIRQTLSLPMRKVRPYGTNKSGQEPVLNEMVASRGQKEQKPGSGTSAGKPVKTSPSSLTESEGQPTKTSPSASVGSEGQPISGTQEEQDTSSNGFPRKEQPGSGDKEKIALTLPSVYYKVNKYKVEKDMTMQLDSIAELMKEDTQYRLIITSYTDSRHSHWYNEQLSAKRSQAARLYLVSKGVAVKRIATKYYGERRLINECKDGVDCEEAKHQENRRTDFTLYLPNRIARRTRN
jgi:outer membrane protein OmpA-like peptidoglycan-associated protein/tetratricopeptide (TPR) repeat protein/5-hydroxyisourate hydrolase-like protein (transthyretin family)